MVLALVGLLAGVPCSLTAMQGRVLQHMQHGPSFPSFCARLLISFALLFYTMRSVVSLIATMPQESAQLGLERVHRCVAARWPRFGYVIGLAPQPWLRPE